MRSPGPKRDITRTLATTDLREAQRRRPEALASIQAYVDEALREARMAPLSDWTADWTTHAAKRREELEAARRVVTHIEEGPDGSTKEWTAWDDLIDVVREEAEQLDGPAARQFAEIATGSGMTVAQGMRQWIEGERIRVRGNTIASHEAAFGKLGVYLAKHGKPSLEGVALADVTRRIAGEFIQKRRDDGAAPQTIQREAAAFNGLWRWAMRRGYAEANPWHDQTAGLKGGRIETQRTRPGGQERAYTTDELVKLLRATRDDLAPGRSGYAATMWDVLRLLLLTGCRAGEVMDLRLCDVIADGTAIVVAPEGGKTRAASRIVPLHMMAQRVVRDRIASIPTSDPAAPLWPEVPPQGRDKRRSKVIATRFGPIRTKLLGPSDEVDLHSFRRSFLTAAETALHHGGRLNAELIALIVGHKRGGLAFDLYSDWAKLGRRQEVDGRLAERLKVLAAAVDDVVAMGFEEGVRKVLEGTQGDRPGVVRVAPAFVRRDAGRR